MTRKEAIDLCSAALRDARGRFREDCDGTTEDTIREAAEAAAPWADVSARFRAAVDRTDFRGCAGR
jgi:hypothetical protein